MSVFLADLGNHGSPIGLEHSLVDGLDDDVELGEHLGRRDVLSDVGTVSLGGESDTSATVDEIGGCVGVGFDDFATPTVDALPEFGPVLGFGPRDQDADVGEQCSEQVGVLGQAEQHLGVLHGDAALGERLPNLGQEISADPGHSEPFARQPPGQVVLGRQPALLIAEANPEH